MSASESGYVATSASSNRPYQGFRDVALRDRYQNDVALRHHGGATLSGARTGRADPLDRDRELTVTSALRLPQSSVLTSSWPETPPGADPLPGQLDRWLASRGAELVAVRRHIHAHPELSGQEFETASMVARELSAAGLSPRMLPKGNGVICDVGYGDRVVQRLIDVVVARGQSRAVEPLPMQINLIVPGCCCGC